LINLLRYLWRAGILANPWGWKNGPVRGTPIILAEFQLCFRKWRGLDGPPELQDREASFPPAAKPAIELLTFPLITLLSAFQSLE
jgi:hypothetical protein